MIEAEYLAELSANEDIPISLDAVMNADTGKLLVMVLETQRDHRRQLERLHGEAHRHRPSFWKRLLRKVHP